MLLPLQLCLLAGLSLPPLLSIVCGFLPFTKKCLKHKYIFPMRLGEEEGIMPGISEEASPVRHSKSHG